MRYSVFLIAVIQLYYPGGTRTRTGITEQIRVAWDLPDGAAAAVDVEQN
jgi:hypothetical protein